MRYFMVRYVTKPDGKMDEVVSASKKIKLADSQFCAVILDFKTRQVCQASLKGVTVPRDFVKIRDFYHQYYGRLIDDLEAQYGVPDQCDQHVKNDKDPVSN